MMVLRNSSYNEKFYSFSPYEIEKKDTFADFNTIALLSYGKYSMSCDVYMVLPQYEYTSMLPFYTPAVNTIKRGECLVSKNALELRHAHVGDTLRLKGLEEDSDVKIVGELPSIKGLEHRHHGVIVLGYDKDAEDYLKASRPRYLSFGKDFKNFGLIKIDGNLLLKIRDIEAEERFVYPRMALGLAVIVASQLLIAQLWVIDDAREKRALIITGGRKGNIFRYFFIKKVLQRLLPLSLVFTYFLLTNLSFLMSSLMIFGIFLGVSFILMLFETCVLTWRS